MRQEDYSKEINMDQTTIKNLIIKYFTQQINSKICECLNIQR